MVVDEDEVDSCVFFFQAEDGIRDYKVTGVQTCALPILHHVPFYPFLLLAIVKCHRLHLT